MWGLFSTCAACLHNRHTGTTGPHQVRTILDKYDEEEEEVVVAIGSGGQLEADRIRRQQDMRKKLAEGAGARAGCRG